MPTRMWFFAVLAVLSSLLPVVSQADSADCQRALRPLISFIEFESKDGLTGETLTVKGKLTLPLRFDFRKRCFVARTNVPAVVILHGDAGVDSRGHFYEEALNVAGIATLQIDFWEARGVTGIENRPPAPIATYPDSFAALAYLSDHPNIDADRIGVLGFSYGGVMSLTAAEQLYAGMFGGGLTFKAHVAQYPVCYAANLTLPGPTGPITPAEFGSQFLNLTGAPVLIQVGSEDDYDNGSEPCEALAAAANATNGDLVHVNAYEGAFHAWDRLQVPVTVSDRFGDRGSFFSTGIVPLVEIVPDVDQAYLSRFRAVQFFRRNL